MTFGGEVDGDRNGKGVVGESARPRGHGTRADHQAVGGTPHAPFSQVIQDPVAYSPRTHHSNMDNWDHAVAEDLQQAATVIASLV